MAKDHFARLVVPFVALALTGVACGDDSHPPTEPPVDGYGIDRSDDSAEDAPESAPEVDEAELPETTTTTAMSEVEVQDLISPPYVTTFGDLDGISLPEGRDGDLSVIAQGQLTPEQTVPVLVRNGTYGDVVDIRLYHEDQDDMHLEDSEGVGPHLEPQVTGEGRLLPYIVAPGEIALGYVYMEDDYSDTENPGELDFRADHYDNEWDLSEPLAVSEADLDGSSFTLTLTNLNERRVIEIYIFIVCIDATGTPFGHPTFDYAPAFRDQRLEPGQGGTFTLEVSGLPEDCSRGVTAAVGRRA